MANTRDIATWLSDLIDCSRDDLITVRTWTTTDSDGATSYTWGDPIGAVRLVDSSSISPYQPYIDLEMSDGRTYRVIVMKVD